MSRLNIRCCCQPEKVLGSLPWSGWPANQNGLYRRFLLEPTGELNPCSRLETVVVEIRRFYEPDAPEKEWAIYGDDRPIEFWQRIRGYLPPQQPGLRG
ncbi:hypothetical protein [Hydrogenophaga sp. 2FB]|uniref:hypothetical protein n=1 Tax=Hydrogenophaga sp. 2FB TaxID=2502187 RepID=UPI0010F545F8|nr:hypothetical protein [Hydrogenophaga sp. 2FB]